MSRLTVGRRLSAWWAAFSVLALVLAGLVGGAVGSANAEGDVKYFNPFAVNNGFTIVSQGDATLGNGELEGSIAAFGTIATTNTNGYPVIHNAAGSADYTVPLSSIRRR